MTRHEAPVPGASRRRFVAGLAASVLVPGRAVAQKVRIVGYLSNEADGKQLEELLAARGYVPGRDLRVVVEIRSPDGRDLEEKARVLVAARPDVLVAWGAGNVNTLARLTQTVPIVCGGTADPVGLGYAKSVDGGITGKVIAIG